jgi:hypothetical protein
VISNLCHNLPYFLESRRIREELIVELRGKQDVLHLISKSKDLYLKERLFQIYCYFSHAYINAFYENQANRLPIEISLPLYKLSNKLKRKPFLSFYSYCLCNWKKNDENRDFYYNNLKIIQSCTNENEEEQYILSLLINHKNFLEIVKNINNIKKNDYKSCKIILDEIYSFLSNMQQVKVPEKFSILNRHYKVEMENCSIVIENNDKIFYTYALELLFNRSFQIDENLNFPRTYLEFLNKIVLFRDKFNNFTMNEKKYKDCIDLLIESRQV